jgi:hypothetical protein
MTDNPVRPVDKRTLSQASRCGETSPLQRPPRGRQHQPLNIESTNMSESTNDRIGGPGDIPVTELSDCHDEFDREKYLAIRKAEAAKIDPAVAEVTWVYAQILDPYGVYEPPKEDDQIGREYFACNPGSEIWVHFDDLPDPIRDRLWKTHRAALAFPAGLVRSW